MKSSIPITMHPLPVHWNTTLTPQIRPTSSWCDPHSDLHSLWDLFQPFNPFNLKNLEYNSKDYLHNTRYYVETYEAAISQVKTVKYQLLHIIQPNTLIIPVICLYLVFIFTKAKGFNILMKVFRSKYWWTCKCLCSQGGRNYRVGIKDALLINRL